MISTIPTRQVDLDNTTRGKPTIAYLDTDEYTRTVNGVEEKKVPKWEWSGTRKPSPLQTRKLVALMLMSDH